MSSTDFIPVDSEAFDAPPEEDHWAGEPPWPSDKNARAVTDDADQN